MSTKIAFIIPGYGFTPERKEYLEIGKAFSDKGIKPIYVTVKWNYSTISENVEEFLKLYNSFTENHKIILGFSFGAVIGYLAAAKSEANSLILCSLSPYFAEDLPDIKISWKKYIGKKRVADFEKIVNLKIAPQIQAKIFLLYGTKEEPEVKKRAEETYDSLKTLKKLIPIEEAKHDISSGKYLAEVFKVIQTL